MAGEISPDIMFWECGQKKARMAAGGCGSVQMIANGSMGKEGSKNKAKRAINGRGRHIFQCMHTTKKNGKYTGMVMVARENHLEELRGRKGRAVRFEYKTKGKTRKQTGRQKKKAKPGHTKMLTQGHKCNKK